MLARTTRRQSLTEIGQQYVEQCRQILAQIAAAETGAEAMRATPRGKLKITAPVSFGSECIAPLMADYLDAYPEVSLELNLNDRTVDLVEEGFDAAIRIGKLEDSAMVARALRPYAMVICAAPAYLARHGTPRTPADLARHECVDFMQWSRHMRWRLSGKEAAPRWRGGREPLPLEQWAGAAHGGPARLRHRHAGGNPDGRRYRRGQAGAAAGRTTCRRRAPCTCVYARDRQPTPKLTTFIDFLLERYGPAATPPPATLT